MILISRLESTGDWVRQGSAIEAFHALNLLALLGSSITQQLSIPTGCKCGREQFSFKWTVFIVWTSKRTRETTRAHPVWQPSEFCAFVFVRSKDGKPGLLLCQKLADEVSLSLCVCVCHVVVLPPSLSLPLSLSLSCRSDRKCLVGYWALTSHRRSRVCLSRAESLLFTAGSFGLQGRRSIGLGENWFV